MGKFPPLAKRGLQARCLGYTPLRHLEKHGIHCAISPPNKVDRPGNKKRIKTDKVDALLIARMVKKGGGKVFAAYEAGLTSPLPWLHAAPSSGKARDTLRNHSAEQG
jgi:hypothetical protein